MKHTGHVESWSLQASQALLRKLRHLYGPSPTFDLMASIFRKECMLLALRPFAAPRILWRCLKLLLELTHEDLTVLPNPASQLRHTNQRLTRHALRRPAWMSSRAWLVQLFLVLLFDRGISRCWRIAAQVMTFQTLALTAMAATVAIDVALVALKDSPISPSPLLQPAPPRSGPAVPVTPTAAPTPPAPTPAPQSVFAAERSSATPTVAATTTPSSTPTVVQATATATAPPTATAQPTSTPFVVPTATPTPAPTATPTPAPTATPTLAPTATPVFSTPLPPTDIPASVMPTTTVAPIATALATATPAATIEPTAITAPEPGATATAEPTATPISEPTATSTPTFTPEPTASSTPTPTVSAPPGQGMCSGVQVQKPYIDDTATGSEIVLPVGGAGQWRIQKIGLKFPGPTGKPLRITITRFDNTQAVQVPINLDGEYVSASLEKDLWFTATGAVLHVAYSGEQATLRAQDSFRLQYEIGGVLCAESGAFATDSVPAAAPPAAGLRFVQPTTDQATVTQLEETRFRIELDQAANVNRIEFAVLDATGNSLWRWSEYTSSYCAFGTSGRSGDETCNAAPESWWQKLYAGRYTIRATVFNTEGQYSTKDQAFEKR